VRPFMVVIIQIPKFLNKKADQWSAATKIF